MFFSYCSSFASPYLYFCSRQLTGIIFRYALPIRNTYDYDYHPVFFSVQYRFIIHNVPFFTLKSYSDLDGKLFDYRLMIYMFTVIVKSIFSLLNLFTLSPSPPNPLPYGSCQSVFCMYKSRQKFFKALSRDWSAAYVWMWRGNCSLLLL